MHDYKHPYIDTSEPPLTWGDVIGSIGVFVIVASLVILAKVLA
jgi:hypothetical protein